MVHHGPSPPHFPLNASHSRVHHAPYASAHHTDQPGPSSSGTHLTPLRKHHKLLKDGSGGEVWPEYVEHIFVEGLQAYWNHPVSHSEALRSSTSDPSFAQAVHNAVAPARSRYRNAFLVQYLCNRGIRRSRKQVASHLQVLKNMWKAEGNLDHYYLVAGPDQVPSTISASDQHPSRQPSPAFSVSSSSSRSSSSFSRSIPPSSPDLWTKTSISSNSSASSSVPSSPLKMNGFVDMHHALPALDAGKLPGDSGRNVATALLSGEAPGRTSQLSRRQQQRQHSWIPTLEPNPALLSQVPSSMSPVEPASLGFITPTALCAPATTTPPPLIPLKLSLDADGMQPLEVRLDRLWSQFNSSSGVLNLHLRLQFPCISSASSLSVQGFGAQVHARFPVRLPNGHWKLSSVRCITQIWGVKQFESQVVPPMQNRQGLRSPVKQESLSANSLPQRSVSSSNLLSCMGSEVSAVEVTPAAEQMVLLKLPDSALTRCRWLEQGATMISQRLTLDNEVVLYLQYDLCREGHLTSAKVVGYDRVSAAQGHAMEGSVSADPTFTATAPSSGGTKHSQFHSPAQVPHEMMPENFYSSTGQFMFPSLSPAYRRSL